MAHCRHLLRSSYGLRMHGFLQLTISCEIATCRYTCTGSLLQHPFSGRHRALTRYVERAQWCLSTSRLDGGLARAGIEGFSKGSEINIAAAVANRSLGSCGSPFNKRSLLLRGMVLSGNTDTEPFSSKKIVDCQSIPIDLYSGSSPAESFPFLGSLQCARQAGYLNIELKVKFQVQALI